MVPYFYKGALTDRHSPSISAFSEWQGYPGPVHRREVISDGRVALPFANPHAENGKRGSYNVNLQL